MNFLYIKEKKAVYLLIIGVLLIPVFIDLINGYLIQVVKSDFSLGVLYRSILLFVLLPFLFFKKNRFLIILVISFLSLWVLSNFVWINHSDYYSLFDEIKIFSKTLFIYIILSFLIYTTKKYNFTYISYINLIVLFGVIGSLAIIISFLTGIGVKTYGTYAFGITSFFKAQNDVGLALLISYCFTNFLIIKQFDLRNFSKFLLILFGLILIGTRTTIIGSLIIPLIFFITYMILTTKISYKL